jgi:hypothetical protein
MLQSDPVGSFSRLVRVRMEPRRCDNDEQSSSQAAIG